MKNKVLIKIIAMMCAANAIAATTPALVRANPNKLLGKKTERPNKDKDSNCNQSDDCLEKKQIKSLIYDLKNAYKLENISDNSKKIEEAITSLSKMQNFYEMEPEIAKAIGFAIQKRCFSEMRENNRYKIARKIFEEFDPLSNKIKDILDKCANNEQAQKFVAMAIKRWINQAYINLSIFNEKISDKLDLDLRRILTKCLQTQSAKKFVAWALADLTCMKVVPCVCKMDEQESIISGSSEQKSEDKIPRFVISVDEEHCEVDSENEIELKNMLARCLDNNEAKKYIALAVERLIKMRYFNYASGDAQSKRKIRLEIENILEKCADSEDATKIVASAVGELINSYQAKDFTESDINKIINLLSKCSNNNDSLRKNSIAVYNLTSVFSTIYESDIYAKNNDVLDENNLFNIDDNEQISAISCCDEDKSSNEVKNIEIGNLINSFNILSDSNIFHRVSNNVLNYIKNNQTRDNAQQNIKVDLNKDVIADNLHGVFDLLYICINNSNSTGYYSAKSMQQLLHVKKFQSIVKNNSKIKSKIVESLSKCWSLHTSDEPTYDIIESIINRYSGKLFNDSDIKTIKNDKKIEWQLETKDRSFDIYTNSDDEKVDEKTINQNIIDKNSDNENNKKRNDKRKCANSIILETVDLKNGIFYMEDYPDINDINIKNRFDKFLYDKISKWDLSKSIFSKKFDEDDSSQDRKLSKINEILIKKFIEKEPDLIKQCVLEVMFKHKECDSPYDYLTELEKIYFDWLKEYYADNNVNYAMKNYETQKNAYKAAISDAMQNKTRNLKGEPEEFKSAYDETYELAVAFQNQNSN